MARNGDLLHGEMASAKALSQARSSRETSTGSLSSSFSFPPSPHECAAPSLPASWLLFYAGFPGVPIPHPGRAASMAPKKLRHRRSQPLSTQAVQGGGGATEAHASAMLTLVVKVGPSFARHAASHDLSTSRHRLRVGCGGPPEGWRVGVVDGSLRFWRIAAAAHGVQPHSACRIGCASVLCVFSPSLASSRVR